MTLLQAHWTIGREREDGVLRRAWRYRAPIVFRSCDQDGRGESAGAWIKELPPELRRCLTISGRIDGGASIELRTLHGTVSTVPVAFFRVNCRIRIPADFLGLEGHQLAEIRLHSNSPCDLASIEVGPAACERLAFRFKIHLGGGLGDSLRAIFTHPLLGRVIQSYLTIVYWTYGGVDRLDCGLVTLFVIRLLGILLIFTIFPAKSIVTAENLIWLEPGVVASA